MCSVLHFNILSFFCFVFQNYTHETEAEAADSSTSDSEALTTRVHVREIMDDLLKRVESLETPVESTDSVPLPTDAPCSPSLAPDDSQLMSGDISNVTGMETEDTMFDDSTSANTSVITPIKAAVASCVQRVLQVI